MVAKSQLNQQIQRLQRHLQDHQHRQRRHFLSHLQIREHCDADASSDATDGCTGARVYADGVVVDDPQTATDDYDLNEVERDAGTETIDEDSTPLGNMDLEKDDDHKCCILHFILLLLALIVELIYTP